MFTVLLCCLGQETLKRQQTADVGVRIRFACILQLDITSFIISYKCTCHAFCSLMWMLVRMSRPLDILTFAIHVVMVESSFVVINAHWHSICIVLFRLCPVFLKENGYAIDAWYDANLLCVDILFGVMEFM